MKSIKKTNTVNAEQNGRHIKLMKNTTKINAENKNPVFYMGIFVYTLITLERAKDRRMTLRVPSSRG